MGCRRSPFLNMGTTLAVVQSVGIIPCFSEAWKNSVNVGVISSASVLSSLVGMWSGPVALCSLSVHRSLWMPSGVIMMCCCVAIRSLVSSLVQFIDY